jgi:N-acetylglucosaminyldiphosphoundecaprenol N-acetyl-beta-D-mannosaminyltransferase
MSTRASTRTQLPLQFDVLGVPVAATQIPQTIGQIESWIAQRDGCHFVAVTGMHGIMEAKHNAYFRRILHSADLVVPDGMPLVWLGRSAGFPLRQRVYGPELMMNFFEQTGAKGYRHFLYGGAEGIAQKLSENLRSNVPGLVIAGTHCPPFRPLTEAEDDAIVSHINKSRADVLWVALGTPRQERWMYEHRSRLNVPVIIGVGAAFDFCAGAKKQAPIWMRENGLEWLFRLVQEPKRLWRRYIVYGSEFAFRVVLARLRF